MNELNPKMYRLMENTSDWLKSLTISIRSGSDALVNFDPGQVSALFTNSSLTANALVTLEPLLKARIFPKMNVFQSKVYEHLTLPCCCC